MTDHVDDPRTRRPLVEYVTDPVVVIEDGVVRRTNAALSSVFGYDGDELAGTAFSSLVHPDQRDRFEALLDDVAPAGDRPVEGRFRLRDAEGTWLSVELALVAPGGDRPACVVTVRDISRLRRRERTLAELHRAAADIEACENIGAVCERAVAAAENILDHDWCGIFFPEGEYFVFQAVSSGLNMEPGDRGIRVDEGLGGKVYETGEPLVLGTREEHVDAAPINELDDIPFESILTVPVGEFGVFQAISSEQHAYDEEDLEFLQLLLSHVRGALTQLEREARLRERERELRRKNERLEEFAGVVTHDLRNPLQIAGGRIDLVRETGDLSHLDRVEAALAREAEVEPEPVAFGAAAREAWTVVEGEGTFELAETATIRADRDRLVRLLENLFANSVEHGGEDVTVWAGTTEEGFYMADDGVGIPPERREEVFESGFSTAEAGTGLGLGIVAELVEAHGWEIEIDESEAGGARFEVTGVAFP